MIICFSGFKNSGKDTCADYLIKNHQAIRIALADPLKNMVSEEFGIDRSSLDDPNRKESPILTMPIEPKDAFTKMLAEFMVKEFRNANGKQPSKYGYYNDKFVGLFTEKDEPSQLYHTPRSLAILKGSTNRAVTPNYWTDRAFGVMEAKLDENSNQLIVVTDIRYKSELAKFKERFGGQVVFVRVNRHEKSTSTDPSEMDLVDAEFDFYVDNAGSLDDTYWRLEDILERI